MLPSYKASPKSRPVGSSAARRRGRSQHRAWSKSRFESNGSDNSLDEIVGGLQRGVVEAGAPAGDDLAGIAFDGAGEDRLAGPEIGDRGHRGILARFACARAKGRTHH